MEGTDTFEGGPAEFIIIMPGSTTGFSFFVILKKAHAAAFFAKGIDRRTGFIDRNHRVFGLRRLLSRMGIYPGRSFITGSAGRRSRVLTKGKFLPWSWNCAIWGMA